ncbi:MAG: site-specific DNA-methyltransferase, partial [Phycisphaerae bacterium]
MSKLEVAKDYDPAAACTIFQGDCRNLLAQVPDGIVQLVVTSPPYNLGKEYESKLSLKAYIEQQRPIIEECYRVLNPEGSLCWQVGNFVENGEIYPLDIALFPIFTALGLHLRNRIVWRFGHGLHCSKRFSGRYEVVLWFTKTDRYVFNLDPVRVPAKYPTKRYFKGPRKGAFSCNPLGKNPSDVWDIPNVKANHVEKTIHPCQFPIELVERLVLALSDEGDVVLDPFMGVGSTAIAALMHRRRALGAELVPEYVKIAEERIRLAQTGNLLIRPIERTVFDPRNPNRNLPPRKVVTFHPSATDCTYSGGRWP